MGERRREPRDDMISDLLAAEITRDDGTKRQLDKNEVLTFITLLEVAGSETTARLLGWGALLLARHPDQRAKLVNDPGLIPNAVEELLRYEAPSPIQARFVTRDVEWHGTVVPRNSCIALLTASAAGDERQFAEPDRFDVERQFEKHLSFGYGIHFCLGASLARLEGITVLEETLARMPEWHVDESAVEMVRTTTVRGPAHVPIQPNWGHWPTMPPVRLWWLLEGGPEGLFCGPEQVGVVLGDQGRKCERFGTQVRRVDHLADVIPSS